ncbi:MAG: hypothetical protein ACREUU_04425, partial [Gammaproteobacteria bacterium]
LGIALAVWFAGEAARKLHEDFLSGSMRADTQRSVELLAGHVSEAMIARDAKRVDAMIRQYTEGWPDITYVHISDDAGVPFTEWQKRPIRFGEGILKFEAPIGYGGAVFGTLSLYVDLNPSLAAMRGHIDRSRRQTALILLAVTLIVVSAVNYATLRDISSRRQKSGAEESPGGK